MKRIKLLVVFLVLGGSLVARAQKDPPFWKEIQAFRKADSIAMPSKGSILFMGSSSITLWKDVQEYFPSHKILNRGFGGSSLFYQIRYAEDVIFKCDPKQIVIYCGENDLVDSDTVTSEIVVDRFKTLFGMIRKKYKKVPVAYISMKPSPSRQRFMLLFEKGNAGIREFLATQKRTAFIDVYHSMLKDDGTPLTDIFLGDNLHMNKKGYAIWQKIIEPYLLK